MSINLEKEILLRKELLEKIERETLQVEEVGEGTHTLSHVCFFLSTKA